MVKCGGVSQLLAAPLPVCPEGEVPQAEVTGHPDGIQQRLGHFSGSIGCGKGQGERPFFRNGLGVSGNGALLELEVVRFKVQGFVCQGLRISVRLRGWLYGALPQHAFR